MPKLRNQNPAYSRHKGSGQAVITLDGKDIYLGSYNSVASRNEYDRVIAEWLANGRRLQKKTTDYSVAEVAAQFWTYAQVYYAEIEGKPNKEREAYKTALAPLVRLYGRKIATDFGPLALETVRNAMIDQGWCRTHVNRQIARLKMVFKWAVSREMIGGSVHHALSAVSGLRKGHSKARESAPVKPVSDAMVNVTLDHVSPTIQAMINFQLLTGCRPGEMCQMRTGDIDRSGEVWVYTPGSHKTEHHGHARTIHIGARAQAALMPFLKMDPAAYCFSPAEAEDARRDAQHAARKTPAHQGNNIGTNRRRRPKRPAGDKYEIASYRRAIARGCDTAFPPPDHLAKRKGESGLQWQRRLTPEQRTELAKWRKQHSWHPHQLRHAAATAIRKQFGIESAQHVLGHASPNMTLVYAEKNSEVARHVAAVIG